MNQRLNFLYYDGIVGYDFYFLEIFDECYQDATREASDRSQLPLDKLPVSLLGSLEEILDENWFSEYSSSK
ncbi:DUF29 family protein [Nostoc sp. FACHB-973]|nr:DUF29 family protein [Nostoc sp. FACHB-973]